LRLSRAWPLPELTPDAPLTFRSLWDCTLWVQWCYSFYTVSWAAFCTDTKVISHSLLYLWPEIRILPVPWCHCRISIAETQTFLQAPSLLSADNTLRSRGVLVHVLEMWFSRSGLLLPATGSGVRFLCVPEPDWLWIVCLLKKCYWLFAWLYLCGVKQESDCLCQFVTDSGADLDWKFGNRIGSGLKKTRVPTPLLQSARISSDHAKIISNFASLKSYQHYNVGVSLILHLSVMCPSHFCRVTSPCCSWLHRLEPLRQAQQKDGNSGH